MADGNATVLSRYGIEVTAVDSATGAITNFSTTGVPAPRYLVVDTTQPRPMLHAPTAGGDIDETIRFGYFKNRMQINNSSGSTTVTTPTVATSGALGAAGFYTHIGGGTTAAWEASWGVKGSGTTAGGSASSKGNRWPTSANLIWCLQSDVLTSSGSNTGHATTIKVGQEIFVRPDDLLPGTNIPAGTKITSKREIPAVITGVSITSSFGTSASGTEVTSKGYYFTLSNPVELAADQVVSVRGAGATFSNDTFSVPEKWKVILQSTGAVDPLSDPAGVVGNVKVATTNSNIAIINQLDTINAFDPRIWPGHRVTSVLQNGALQNTIVYVKDVLQANVSHAKVEFTTNVSLPQGEPLRFVFEDPQDWRIKFDVTAKQTGTVYTGTELQVPDNGTNSFIWNDSGTIINDISGIIGAKPTKNASSTGIEVNESNIDEGFINRTKRIGALSGRVGNAETYPMNYTMTIADRGIYFGVWESNWSAYQKKKNTNDVFFSWVLIQRPVDRITGRILTTGRCPLFCINSVGNKYWKFIVRESDAQHPTQGDPDTRFYEVDGDWKVSEKTSPYRTPADAHTEDSFAIINSTRQIALTEDSKFLISFLHNLTTPRFRYSEELDLIGQTSADVCMATNDISITAYQESGPRTYRAMPANNPYNTGLRVAVLKDIPVKPDTPVA
jgi:hypothetical protein